MAMHGPYAGWVMDKTAVTLSEGAAVTLAAFVPKDGVRPHAPLDRSRHSSRRRVSFPNVGW
jgi:hypothetical protein